MIQVVRKAGISALGLVAIGASPHLVATQRMSQPAIASTSAYPAWSPDGTRIAFQSNRTGDFEIYVADVAGSGVTRLTRSVGLDLHPSWSPDSRRIVFASARTGNMYSSPGTLQLYSMNADGSDVVRLTNNARNDFAPEWSPDGRRIAFLTDRDGPPEVYVMNADGSGQLDVTGHLTKARRERGNPHWSPDGERIVFDSDTGTDRSYHIVSIGADGRDLRQVTHTVEDVFFPSYSPDGRWLAYGHLRDGDWEIVVARADGSAPANVSRSPGPDFWQSWSPDGSRLVFASRRSGHFELYVMNRDGSGVRRIAAG